MSFTQSVKTLFLAASLLYAGSSSASIMLVMGESGSDIRVEWSGSVDTTGLSFVTPFTGTAEQTRGQFNLWLATGSNANSDVYGGASLAFNNPATSFFNLVGTGTGPSIGMQTGSSVFLPENYVSNSFISGILTISGTDFATAGILDGITSTATWDAGAAGTQTISFVTDQDAFPSSSSSVPVPATGALFLAGVLGAVYRRKRTGTRIEA